MGTRITNFVTTALESLEAATSLIRARRAPMHVVRSLAGNAATSTACCLLATHGIVITSDLSPHAEMCDRIAELESAGQAPAGAAATLRVIENRFQGVDRVHEQRVAELLPLIRRLADRIEQQDPRGGRISLAVQDLEAALQGQCG